MSATKAELSGGLAWLKKIYFIDVNLKLINVNNIYTDSSKAFVIMLSNRV